MYPSVKEVTPHDDFTLSLRFENGEEGILDIKPLLHLGVFQRIRDLGNFMRVRVSFDTIQWDCVKVILWLQPGMLTDGRR
jgi:hypothetical protein